MKAKSLTIFFISLILIFSASYYLRRFWIPYYNYYFTEYNYSLPKGGEDFVINTLPYHAPTLPPFITNLLETAFHEYNVVLDDNRKPNMIVLFNHNVDEYHQLLAKHKYYVSYITFSNEKHSIRAHRYRRNGPPFAELISTTPKNDREFYYPCIVHDSLDPIRKKPGDKRKKFLVYISSNCIKYREELFALIKKKNLPLKH